MYRLFWHLFTLWRALFIPKLSDPPEIRAIITSMLNIRTSLSTWFICWRERRTVESFTESSKHNTPWPSRRHWNPRWSQKSLEWNKLLNSSYKKGQIMLHHHDGLEYVMFGSCYTNKQVKPLELQDVK